MISDNF